MPRVKEDGEDLSEMRDAPVGSDVDIDDARAKISKAKAFRADMKSESKVSSPGDPEDVDENGIPFHRLGGQRATVLVGVVDGIMRWPLWTGKLARDKDGKAYPKICAVPVNQGINAGRGTAYYKDKKGFKEVTEIPDTYAEYREPYVDAIEKWNAEEKERANLRAAFERAGLTTTKSMKGMSRG